MKLMYKDTTSIHSRMKKKPMASIPSSSSSPSSQLSPLNIYKERPIKTNSSNLSFEGLFFKPVLDSATKAHKAFDANEVLKMTDKYLGSSTRNLYDHIVKSELSVKDKLFESANSGQVKFHKKSILHLIYDGVVYPILVLPKEIVNGAVSALKKFKPFKKWAEKAYDNQTLKKWRSQSKIESQVNALRGMFETVDKLKTAGKSEAEISAELLQGSAKMFDPKTGNYDTKHERSLCRIVSGMIPAFFLANDAYNLSSACDDDPNAASKEKKTRFKQEISRVGLNAYITLITLGALQKYINNSKAMIMLNTAVTVLFTESFARLSNGKQITRLTPEQARAMNAKNNKENGTAGKEYDGIPFKATDKSEQGKTPQFKGEAKTESKDKKKPLLSLNTVLKASAVIIATGFGIRGLRAIKINGEKPIAKAIDDVLKPFNTFYKKITTQTDHTLEKEKFDKIVDVLKNNGFEGLAKKYEEIGNGITKDNLVYLGAKDKKVKPAVDFVIAPFKFIYSTVKLPYTLADKIVSSFIKKEKAAPDINKENVKALAKSIDKIMGQLPKDFKESDIPKLKDYIEDSINKSFNVDNMSGVSNSELANLAKTSATAATIWFLMTDNYNMVMLKSNGEDKSGAELKFKERFVQEGSRLFYQTLLIDLFNSTFRSQYNNSLWGMTWITASNTVISEMLNRKSIGMPIKAHSRAELLEIEKKKEQATGFAGGYYNFMARLTGKNSFAEQRKAKEAKKAQVVKA